MTNRRRVILGGLGLIGLGAGGGWVMGHVALESEIAAILHRRLGYLKLDPNGVRTFATDQTDAVFHKKIPTWNRLRYHLLAASAPSYKRFFMSKDAQSRLARFEDSVLSTYLLSSDFFLNGADESRTVHYVAYYDSLRPCQNPFARSAVAA